MVYRYDDSSSDEGRFSGSKQRRSKSVGAVSKASLGSDSCTFDTMTDAAANELMQQVTKIASKKESKQ